MFDHVGFAASDLEKSRAFYVKALAPLGYTIKMEITPEMTGAGAVTGFGTDRPTLWIGEGKKKVTGLHLAFTAKDRATVDTFYKAAMDAGGTDNGKPGVRPHYHENYYGAFVLDPDGNNIEAVCHSPA